jgi:hypothetical protein
MRVSLKIFLMLFLFLMLTHTLGTGYSNTPPAHNTISQFTPISNAATDTSMFPEAGGEIYSAETLQLSDALLSPITSFQFGFVEFLACFLFALFTFSVVNQKGRSVSFFTNSYLHTLFLSVILINAP